MTDTDNASDNITTMTGRDGRIDLEAKIDQLSHLVEHGHTYRVIEIVGTSEKGIDDAVRSAIGRAHQTIRGLRWFEVTRTSGHIKDGRVSHFQVTLKVGFTLEDAVK
jgi:flavin-binding protein dodecin